MRKNSIDRVTGATSSAHAWQARKMGSSLFTFQIAIVVLLMWRPSHTVEQLRCDETINLNPLTAETYRFGDLTNTYSTLQSCTFTFALSDASESIIYQVTPRCTAGGDGLKINNGDENLCCDGCTKPIDTTLTKVSFTSDSTTGPNELGFDIRVVTGKEESSCADSSNNSITVGTSPVIITSPNFPAEYPNNKECNYIISSQDSNKGLSLTLEVISLDFVGNTCYDFILLGIYDAAPVKICTSYTNNLFLPGSAYTSEGEIYLKFYSDGSHPGYGFRVKIIQVDLGATEAPTAASTTLAQKTQITTVSTAATQTTTTTATPTSKTTETTVQSTTSKITKTSETTAGPTTVQSASPTIAASTAESTSVESTAAANTDPTTETIESNETTQDSTTTSMTTKPEEVVSSTEVPSTTASPTTSPQPTTTGFFDGLTTTAQVVALTGLAFLGVTPIFVILIFCLSEKRKKPSRDNQSQNSFFQKDAQYEIYNHYPMTNKSLFYKYWAEL